MVSYVLIHCFLAGHGLACPFLTNGKNNNVSVQ